MSKIEFIDNYIKKCEDILTNGNKEQKAEIFNQIISTFSSEIENIKLGFFLESTFRGNDHSVSTSIDQDLLTLEKKIILLKLNLLEEEKMKEYELKLANINSVNISYNSPLSTVTNTNTNTNNVSVDIKIITEQIDQLPTDLLTDEEKNQLNDDLYSLEREKITEDKNKIWQKTKPILKFISEKGADVAIAAMPYIINSLK